MKKFLLIIIPILAIIAIIVIAVINGGVTTTKSYTYNVSTGDQIEIKLDTTGGYDIDSNIPFTISKDGNTVTQGSFVTTSSYDTYINALNSGDDVQVLDSASRNDVDYYFYTLYNENDKCYEYDYIIKVKGSNTGVLIANVISRESAEECFGRLTFVKQ